MIESDQSVALNAVLLQAKRNLLVQMRAVAEFLKESLLCVVVVVVAWNRIPFDSIQKQWFC